MKWLRPLNRAPAVVLNLSAICCQKKKKLAPAVRWQRHTSRVRVGNTSNRRQGLSKGRIGNRVPAVVGAETRARFTCVTIHRDMEMVSTTPISKSCGARGTATRGSTSARSGRSHGDSLTQRVTAKGSEKAWLIPRRLWLVRILRDHKCGRWVKFGTTALMKPRRYGSMFVHGPVVSP